MEQMGGMSGVGIVDPARAISAIEARMLWSRFGL